FEGGTADNYDLELGSNTFIPGFEDQLIGIKKNETRDVNVSFPDEYGAKELAGKAAVFEVICRKVSYKEMPELNDEFAKDVSEFDTLEEYKADIRSKLTEELTKRSEQTRENKLIERIVDAVTVEIPEEMTENQIEDMLNEFSYRLSYQGLKMDDYLKYSGMTEEQLKAGYREPAVKAVKSRLVLEAIIKKEGIEPASEEIEAKIAEYAKSSGKTVEEYRKKVSGREFEYIANQVLSDKLMAFLKANNTFAEV
ncbi:MAG TPA: trigger factor, partial [Eubacteriales bacterium]|nr:trigger factor [Eubacteriales bacterium]